jgi:hypothetical protein
MSEELISKDLSVSDDIKSKAKVIPSFDEADAKMSLAFAPTLPIYAFKNARSDSLNSIEDSEMHAAEAPLNESPELIMIDTTSKRKKAEERR